MQLAYGYDAAALFFLARRAQTFASFSVGGLYKLNSVERPIA
jgi:hypothetical protein